MGGNRLLPGLPPAPPNLKILPSFQVGWSEPSGDEASGRTESGTSNHALVDPVGLTSSGDGEADKEGDIMRDLARVAGAGLGVMLEGIQEGSRRRDFEGGVGGDQSCVVGRGILTRRELQTGLE